MSGRVLLISLGYPTLPLIRTFIMLSVKQGGIKYYFFEYLVWLDLRLNPYLPGYWPTLYPLGQWIYIIHVYLGSIRESFGNQYCSCEVGFMHVRCVHGAALSQCCGSGDSSRRLKNPRSEILNRWRHKNRC